MTEPKKTAAEQLRLDKQSQAIVYQGVSIGQAALIFRKDKRTVSAKIAGHVEPCGMRGGFPIYAIAEIAPYLVVPAGDISEHIKNMHHDDLPPLLNKNYWAGRRERQKFEEDAGVLVRADEAAEIVATAFKSCRMSLLLMSDAVERETVLDEGQRATIKGLIDGALADLRAKLIEEFAPSKEQPNDGDDDDAGDAFEAGGETGEPAEPIDEYGGL